MAAGLQQQSPSIKIDSQYRPSGKGPHTDVEVRVAYSLLHAETLSFWLDGITLTHFAVFKKDTGYLVMFKGTRGKHKKVAWLQAATFREALVLAATTLDSGHLHWREDKPQAPPAET